MYASFLPLKVVFSFTSFHQACCDFWSMQYLPLLSTFYCLYGLLFYCFCVWTVSVLYSHMILKISAFAETYPLGILSNQQQFKKVS